MNSSSSDFKAVAALILASLVWSSAYVIMKWALEYFPPLTLIALRICLAATALALFWSRLTKNMGYRRGDWKWFVLLALSEPCFYFIFEIYGLTWTTASQAGAISSLTPILTALAGFIFLGEKLSLRTWLGAFLAIGGALWLTVSAESSLSAPNPVKGNFLVFCAMICATVYFICARRLGQRYRPSVVTAFQTWLGGLFYLPFLFLPGLRPPLEAPPQAWLAVLYLALAVSLGGYSCFNFGLSRMKAGQAAVYVNLIAVFTLAMGIIFLGERPLPAQYMACGIIVGGLYLSRR